jgi:hypothetical protein
MVAQKKYYWLDREIQTDTEISLPRKHQGDMAHRPEQRTKDLTMADSYY